MRIAADCAAHPPSLPIFARFVESLVIRPEIGRTGAAFVTQGRGPPQRLLVTTMETVQFLGNILPTAKQISINGLPKANWKAPDLDLDMTFEVQIQNSKVVVICQTNKWVKADHLMPIFMRALDTARAIVDVFAFSEGVGLTLMFTQLVEPNGQTSQLWPEQPELAALATAVKNIGTPATPADNNLDKVMRLAIQNVTVFRALRDLIDAITQTHVSPHACGRAMEGIRHVIAPGIERKKAWPIMLTALNIDRGYLEVITDTSIGPRHADPEHISGAVCHDIAVRSWTIMNRFFDYLKRGSQPLPQTDFPLLK